MHELPRSSKYRATPHAPVTDAEREGLVRRLNDAFESGLVPGDDYRAHLDTVFAARTLGELVDVVGALPPVATHDTPALVPVGDGRPGELAEARAPGSALIVPLIAGGAFALVALLIVVLLMIL